MTATALRANQLSQYNREAILSAPPARLLTMLYDRLLLDLGRAQFAQETANWDVASSNLLHAQDIVAELARTLNDEAWDGGPNLRGIYDYVMQAMIGANIHRDVERTKECIRLLEPLRQSWHEAGSSITVAAATAPAGGALGIG